MDRWAFQYVPTNWNDEQKKKFHILINASVAGNWNVWEASKIQNSYTYAWEIEWTIALPINIEYMYMNVDSFCYDKR